MKKVLIVEDDQIVAHVYKSRLEKEGFQVEVAPDGQIGFYRLHEIKPDAILLDLMLPKMNGIDLLKKARAVREFQSLPVYVFTNAYVANMINDAWSAGATAVYNKSCVTPRQIIDVLQKHFSDQAPGRGGMSGETNAPGEPRPKDDKAFESQLAASFLKSSPAALAELRRQLQELSKAHDDATRCPLVEQLFRAMRAYAANAGLAGIIPVAKLSAAAEAMLQEMFEKPKSVTPSAIRTAAHAIDALGELAQASVAADLMDDPPIEVLVVDDEMLSRRAIVYALEKAFLKSTAVETPDEALKRTMQRRFDLIFLDVNMPGMDGFAVCEKLKAPGGPNRLTPVVFVTSTADFQARAQSTLRGGSDLIAKPFMFIELTVKALTFALRSRLEQARRNQATAPVEVIL